MRKNLSGGFSLIEIVFAMAIFCVIVVITGRFLVTLQAYLQNSQRSSSRVMSIYGLYDSLANQNVFNQSMALSPENDNLRVCLAGGPLGGCSTNCCSANGEHEFVLLDLNDSTSDLSMKRRLLGTVAKPGYYNVDGAPCNILTEPCYYKVSGTFSAHCPAGASSCDKAELLTLSLRIQPTTPTLAFKERSISLYYTPQINTKPTLQPVANQNLHVGERLKVPVYANSGHPQEKQNFFFSRKNALLLTFAI